MIHEHLELHNVSEIEPWAGYAAGALHRIPRSVSNHFGPRGRWVAHGSAGSEIRFVTDAPTCHLFLGSLKGRAEVLVYRGDYRHDHVILEPGVVSCIELNAPDFKGFKPEALRGRRFHANVWRVFCENSWVALHHLDAHGYAVRPPSAEEKPRRRWLAYGSSITHGSTATRQVYSYVQQCAWRLGVDVINLGMGGACRIEPEMAGFIAGRDDWDLATFELGINIHEMPDAEFRSRAEHLIRTVRARHPHTPIALITHFLFKGHLLLEPGPSVQTADRFDAILRELAATHGLTLIEGQQLLTEAGGLTTDFVHPHDHGMELMGEHLAAALRPLLPA